MRKIISIGAIALLTSGCASLGVDSDVSSNWDRVCRPGHAVRFALPKGTPLPATYRAPERGSCMR